MTDFAASANGGAVVMSSACDENHPPENIVDGQENTFWSTTGLYPQEFIIELSESVGVSQVKMWSSHVRKLTIEKCSGREPDRFEKVLDVEVQDMPTRLQAETHQVNFNAKFVKFIIQSGWDDFCAVNKVSMS